MDTVKSLRLLGLSKKEEKVLIELQKGPTTPLLLSRATKVSRTAVYAILQNLKKRGVAEYKTTDGKKHWNIVSDREADEVIYEAKRALLQIPEGRNEVQGLSDSSIVVHRGTEAIKQVLGYLVMHEKHERFYGLAGDQATLFWNRIFSLTETNRFNKSLKQNGIIAEILLEEGWLEREAKRLGKKWAEDFEGRTTRVNEISPEYFAHGAQIFIFKQSVYLMALGEELVIEIRNSEIQRMILSFFKYIQDTSPVIDANALLRKAIEEMEGSKSGTVS